MLLLKLKSMKNLLNRLNKMKLILKSTYQKIIHMVKIKLRKKEEENKLAHHLLPNLNLNHQQKILRKNLEMMVAHLRKRRERSIIERRANLLRSLRNIRKSIVMKKMKILPQNMSIKKNLKERIKIKKMTMTREVRKILYLTMKMMKIL